VALPVGEEPDLIEVDRLGFGRVELAVSDTGPGGDALYLAGPQHRPVSETVLVFESAFEDVGDDLHVPVSVGAKPLAGSDSVFVDDAEDAEAHVGLVLII
jgi:hypothetical protein